MQRNVECFDRNLFSAQPGVAACQNRAFTAGWLGCTPRSCQLLAGLPWPSIPLLCPHHNTFILAPSLRSCLRGLGRGALAFSLYKVSSSDSLKFLWSSRDQNTRAVIATVRTREARPAAQSPLADVWVTGELSRSARSLFVLDSVQDRRTFGLFSSSKQIEKAVLKK